MAGQASGGEAMQVQHVLTLAKAACKAASILFTTKIPFCHIYEIKPLTRVILLIIVNKNKIVYY